MTFEIQKNQFIKDGKPIKLISGAVHYFRNMRGTWDDIFEKMVACGCNCVETYCAWNLHEKIKDEFRFDGNLNIREFLRTAAKHGLMAIVRPGPYICSEWEFGGLPWWLQNEEEMEIRCFNPKYIEYFDRYLDHLFAEIRPELCTNGGNVIMAQCENEYGSYGDDKKYLNYLRDGYRARGIDVPLFTSDGGECGMVLDGTIDGCLSTLNFGSKVEENFRFHDEIYPDVPKMCMEMWDGWFDAWGDEYHHTTSVEDYTKTVRDMLKRGSLNMYMFIGGTNFGFMNGANHYETFTPDVTSYDYDAILTECGDITPKYLALREIFAQYAEKPLPEIPKNREKKAYGRFELTESAGLLENLEKMSKAIHTEVPKCMEAYGFGFGYISYRTTLNRDYDDAVISFESIGDRAQIYINDTCAGTVYINASLECKFSAKKGDTLTVLCENMGRTNYGSKMMRKKGIAGRCLIDGKIHFGWDVTPLPMENLDAISFEKKITDAKAAFYHGKFSVDVVADTFLKLDGFSKGFVEINGFNIGRFWEIGPQKTLYVPSSLLKPGENDIMVFESDGRRGEPTVEFVDKPDLGKTK